MRRAIVGSVAALAALRVGAAEEGFRALFLAGVLR